MTDPTQCPKCKSENIYPDRHLWVCPECFHEWNAAASPARNESGAEEAQVGVRDAHGNILNTGDSVTLVKELKIKGSSASVKAGPKVKNIRLIDGEDGHNIACKIDGIGALNLKSEFVKKA